MNKIKAVGERINFAIPFMFNGAAIVQQEDSFDTVVALSYISDNEVSQFRDRPLEYGVFVRDDIPFLVLKFQYVGFAAPFNAFVNDISNANFGSTIIYIIDSSTGIIKAVRFLMFSDEIFLKIKETLYNQLRNYGNLVEVDEMIKKIEEEFTVERILSETKFFKQQNNYSLFNN
jgi:hypothetical protein